MAALVLGSGSSSDSTHDQLAVARAIRKRQAERAPPRLLRHLVRVVARLRPENRSAVTPDRRTSRAGARASGALLPPRLFAAARDEAAGLGRRGPGAPVRQLHPHRFMQQRLCRRSRPKTAPATSISPTALARGRKERHLDRCDAAASRSCAQPLTAPPPAAMRVLGRVHDDHHRAVGPGHRARHHDRVVFGQNLDHLADSASWRVSLPIWPAIRMPLRTRPGIRAVTDRAAVAEILVRAVRARKAGEMMALDDAGVAVSLGDSGHVDLVARLEDVGRRDRLAELQLAFAAPVELARRDPGRDFGLGEMAALRRRSRARACCLPEGHLHGVVAVGRRGLDLRHGARPELDHRHRPHRGRRRRSPGSCPVFFQSIRSASCATRV